MLVPLFICLLALGVRADPLEVLARDGNFSQATKLFDLDPRIRSTLNVYKSFDLLAPDDDAFLRTAGDLGLETENASAAYNHIASRLGDVGMRRVAMYHVVVDVAQFFMKKPAETLLKGQFVTFDNATKTLTHNSTLPKPLLNASVANVDGLDVYHVDRLAFPANGTSTADSISDAPVKPENATGADICFPADAMLMLADGTTISMERLRAGHVIRAGEAAEGTSAVVAFTHRVVQGTFSFVRLHTADNSLALSAAHLVYAKGALVRADRVALGDTLRTVAGPRRVVRVEVVRKRGLFAPQTASGNLLVDGIVVSSYTAAVPAYAAHALLAPVRAAVRLGISEEPLGDIFYQGWSSLPSVVDFIGNVELRIRAFLRSIVAIMAAVLLLGRQASRAHVWQL